MEPQVASQIAQFERLPRTALLAALTQRSAQDERAAEETLVHFLRRAHRADDNRVTAILAQEITHRVSGRLARLARVWRLGHPPDLAEDVIDEVLTDIYDQLLSGDASSKFWEIRFWVCFNRRALNIMRKRRAEIDQVVAEEDDAQDEDSQERVYDVQAPLSRFDQPETMAIVSDALSRLPQNQRTAFLLKHWSGYPEENGANDTQSIASMMGVSGRTVRYYLARATKELSGWRAEGEQNV